MLHDGVDIRTVAHFGRHRPAHLETALLLGAPPDLDGVTCADVGCDRRYGLEWDHVNPLSNGGTTSLDDLLAKLSPPRAAWVMVPAAFAGQSVTDLGDRMEPGDIVIDGGNTYYRDDVDRAATLREKGVQYVDVGTSGGVFGLDRGFCLMIGGEADAVRHLDPIFAALAPGVDAVPRTPGREGRGAGHSGRLERPGGEDGGLLEKLPARKGSCHRYIKNGFNRVWQAIHEGNGFQTRAKPKFANAWIFA